MARRNRFLGRWLRHGEGYPDWIVRLFDRRHARWTDDPVHEKVTASGSIERLRGDCCTLRPSRSMRTSRNRTGIRRSRPRRCTRAVERASVARLVASPIARFVRFYVVRLGFLDGIAGLVHIAIGCFASFLKYAKAARALRRSSRNRERCGVGPCARHRLRRLHRHALRRRSCSTPACRFSASITSTRITTSRLKQARLAQLDGRPGFRFQCVDLADAHATERLFADHVLTHACTSPRSPECAIRSSIRPAVFSGTT
jgi:hypothetical protein